MPDGKYRYRCNVCAETLLYDRAGVHHPICFDCRKAQMRAYSKTHKKKVKTVQRSEWKWKHLASTT